MIFHHWTLTSCGAALALHLSVIDTDNGPDLSRVFMAEERSHVGRVPHMQILRVCNSLRTILRFSMPWLPIIMQISKAYLVLELTLGLKRIYIIAVSGPSWTDLVEILVASSRFQN